MPISRRINLVRRMTIRTRRSPLIPLCKKLSVDTLVVNLLHPYMTLTAGARDVLVVNRRCLVDLPDDIMHPMTIIAGWRHNQAHFQQGTPMDALHVLSGSLGILHPIFIGNTRVAVTLRAGLWQIKFENRGIRLLDRTDLMRSMTTPTGGRLRPLRHTADTMNTRRIRLGLRFMTARALGGPHLVRMRNLSCSLMTIRTRQAFVNRF